MQLVDHTQALVEECTCELQRADDRQAVSRMVLQHVAARAACRRGPLALQANQEAAEAARQLRGLRQKASWPA